MITIIRDRDSGKAKEILELARKNNAFIITQDKRAFQVKAKSYGYGDIEIKDYDDLNNDNYTLARPAIIHNGDKMLQWLMDQYYGIDILGFSATKGE
jgi:hypothetical protein